ncbi:acetyl-CoA carboxylase biotin carboxyl carrier protein [Leptolyngbya sp. Cla-17]|uniref:acetyl-CoA carboxylase biotin carboxyl carrier protein n=1 Tax=Leptolyngbya sp. Cla-17 TaxID=2803751 RepID=UPI0027DCC70B|nr:acetyl-CoA carboxylase biotin carboxyl carrier protein [Leptolyngbya sp. Cla-17]
MNELRELLAAINQTDIAELTLKSSDFELIIRRGLRGDDQLLAGVTRVVTPEVVPTPSATTGGDTKSVETSPSPSTTVALPPNSDRRYLEILSPMVGTFYRSPAPDELPFVETGDRIRSGQTVCIIEAMKLMNEIEAEVAGEIIEILVQNGEPVEYNQPLMRVTP